MRALFLSALVAMILLPIQAVAGPEGNYSVEGTNPGNGDRYRGTVTVRRSGQTYAVVWNISGTEFIGTGLGSANVKGTPTMGPASDQDTAISISYISDGSFGLAYYVEQSNGQWKGIWTYGGSTQIGTEIWTPRK